jgi:hypothetical protein
VPLMLERKPLPEKPKGEASKSPLFMALDHQLDDKNDLRSNLKRKSAWSTVVALKPLGRPVDRNAEFVDRIRREFAELNGVDIGNVTVNFSSMMMTFSLPTIYHAFGAKRIGRGVIVFDPVRRTSKKGGPSRKKSLLFSLLAGNLMPRRGRSNFIDENGGGPGVRLKSPSGENPGKCDT